MMLTFTIALEDMLGVPLSVAMTANVRSRVPGIRVISVEVLSKPDGGSMENTLAPDTYK